MPRSYEVAVIGGGANGLTAAAYLARAGVDVIVLEKRFERGGTLGSDDYSTPFTYNIAQESLPLGPDLPAMADLGLADHGVRFIEPDIAVEVLTGAGDLAVGRGGTGLGERLEAMFASVSRACVPLLYQPPVAEATLTSRWRSEGEADAAGLADLTPAGLAALASGEGARLAVRYACAATGFADPGQRLGVIGGFAVARWFSPTLVAGGSKCLANALFRIAAAAGAQCRVSAGVAQVTRAADGLRLSCADGHTVAARSVICTLDPRTTFAELLDADLAGPHLAAAGRAWAFDDLAAFTAHYGIRGDPPASPRPREPYLRLIGFGGGRGPRRAHLGGPPRKAAGAAGAVTTAHDPLQASPGPFGPLHTLRFDTFAPQRHPDGPWYRARSGYRKQCWAFLGQRLPALRQARLLAQFADAPGDLERRFAVTRGGTVRQGALSPAQTLTGRPHESCAGARTPIEGFYLGGGGAHPGIPGLLAAGALAARAVCADRGFGTEP
jgi:phytoene dehydrogenase-like protein